jgi:2-iminobutanoate/2-iminopropanoate deaminase
MTDIVRSQELFAEEPLFSQGIRAGEFTFLAQDGRGPDVSLGGASDAQSQARRSLENLGIALKALGQGLEDLVSLMVLLPNYADAREVAAVLDAAFPDPKKAYPATTFLGVMGLEGGCRVRLDAVATSSPEREQILVPDLPFALGSRCHGVRVGDLLFLSGVDAADSQGMAPQPNNIEAQTVAVLNKIETILKSQGLSLGDIFRTFMFLRGTEHRPGYRESRRMRYQGIFREDEFPANSGIYIQELGTDILLRSVAIAYRKGKTYVSTPKVWQAPGSFSQAIRVGNWLFLAGQDSIGLNPQAEVTTEHIDLLSPDYRRTFRYQAQAVGDLEGQTEVVLTHIKDILEAAGGTMDDLVKTTVYLVAGQERSRFAAAYQKFFKAHRSSSTMPAGLSLEVKELAPSCLVEIDAVALLRN